MTDGASVTGKIQAVARLRSLGRRLPHVPTENERRLLARFERLAATPSLVTVTDVEALAVGWRAWWREKRSAEIMAMAEALPRDLVEGDRWLATYALAARLAAATASRSLDRGDGMSSGPGDPHE